MTADKSSKPLLSAGALQRTCPRCGHGKRAQDTYCKTCTVLIRRAKCNIKAEGDDLEVFELGASEGLT